jgi:hypothetical protein
MADLTAVPVEICPPPSSEKYWTRRGLAVRMKALLEEKWSTLVGTDHGFLFPLQHIGTHQLPLDWPSLLDDFQPRSSRRRREQRGWNWWWDFGRAVRIDLELPTHERTFGI